MNAPRPRTLEHRQVVRWSAPPEASSSSSVYSFTPSGTRPDITSRNRKASPSTSAASAALRAGKGNAARKLDGISCRMAHAPQQAQELLTGFDRTRRRTNAPGSGCTARARRTFPKAPSDRTSPALPRRPAAVPREFGSLGAQSCGNRRAIVVPLQLTELPLPREQPEGIVDSRLQRFVLRKRRDVRFQPRPVVMDGMMTSLGSFKSPRLRRGRTTRQTALSVGHASGSH